MRERRGTKPARRRYPALPKVVEGAGGPIEIQIVPEPNHEADNLGYHHQEKRLIEIRKSLRGDQRWMVLFHELAHVAFWDTGTHNHMSDKVEEAACDAIALARFKEKFSVPQSP
jgi:Zn-dependent peptidase ImmA (M78 family)